MLNLLNEKLAFQTGRLIVDLKVTPRSRENKIVDCYEQKNGRLMIKLKIRGIPRKGEVNTNLIDFISEELHISKSNFQIMSGIKTRKKIMYIDTSINPPNAL